MIDSTARPVTTMDLAFRRRVAQADSPRNHILARRKASDPDALAPDGGTQHIEL